MIMDKRIHDAAAVAASGLKNDAELYLSVRRELEDHLLESIDRLEKSENKGSAVKLALKKFGSPAENADAILKANAPRLKLRSRLRLLFCVLLPVIAIIAAWNSIIPNLRYCQLERKNSNWGFPKSKEFIRKAAAEAGVDIDALPQRQKLLLERKWEKLHTLFPENEAYFAYLFMSSIKLGVWDCRRESQRTNSKYSWLAKAQKIDPDNALYDYFASASLLSKGSIRERNRNIIKDRVLLMAALPRFLKGLRKPFFRDYHEEIKQERLHLNVNKNHPGSKVWANYLQIGHIYSLSIIEYLEQALPLWAEELIAAGKLREAEQLLDCWRLLLKQFMDSQNSYYSNIYCLRMARAFHKKLPELYRQVGNQEKANAASRGLSALNSAWNSLFSSDLPECKSKIEASFKYAPHYWRYMRYGAMLPDNIEVFKTGKNEEYARADRLLLVCIQILLAALMLGYAITWIVIRFELKKSLHPGLFIPDIKTIGVIIAGGIIAPFILWWFLPVLIPGGREFSLNYNSINFLFQGLFLIIGTTLWPMALMRYYTDRRKEELMLEKSSTPNGIILTLCIAAVVAILACLPWNSWYNLEISSCLQKLYLDHKTIDFYKLHSLQIWHVIIPLGFTAVVFILAPSVVTLCSGRNPDKLFNKGTNAAAILVMSSLMLLVCAILAEGYFYYREMHFHRKNNISAILLRSRYEKGGKVLRKLVVPLVNMPQKTSVPHIDYVLTNDASFSQMIVFSSLTKIKKALQKGAKANAVSSENYSALMIACRYRKASVVKLLLDNGAEVGYYSPKHESCRRVPDRLNGVNAIMTAAYYNPDPEVIRLLVKYGAKVNGRALKGYSRNRNYTWYSAGMTPLMLACWHNNPEVIEALLEAGANPSLKGAFGKDIFYYLGKNPQIYGNKLKNKMKSLIESRKYHTQKN